MELRQREARAGLALGLSRPTGGPGGEGPPEEWERGVEQGRPEHELLTPAEVARALRVSPMTVYRLIHSGELPAIRIGRAFRISQVSLREFMRRGTHP